VRQAGDHIADSSPVVETPVQNPQLRFARQGACRSIKRCTKRWRRSEGPRAAARRLAVKLQAIPGRASIRTTQVYGHLPPDHQNMATAILESSEPPKSTHRQRTKLSAPAADVERVV
jgi:hypothetical protein